MRIHYVISLLLTVLLLSCEHDSYDTGSGKYSHLHTDYVTVRVQNNYVQSITTDEEKVLPFSEGMKVDVQPADTTLRWLLYYNERSDAPIEIVGRNAMILLKPIESSKVVMKTDPVSVTSVWMSKSGAYMNMRLGLKTGNTSDKVVQTIALVKNGVNEGVVYYTLYHDQSDVPQYYTQEYLFTVKAPEQKEIDLTINTYNGTFRRRYKITQQ